MLHTYPPKTLKNDGTGPCDPRHQKNGFLLRRKLWSNCEADPRLCFHYTDSTISPLVKLQAILCDCTDRFVWS